MRALSSAAAITIHAAVAAAFLLGTTQPARTTPIVFPSIDLGSLPLPVNALQSEALVRRLFPTDWAPRRGVTGGMQPDGPGSGFVEPARQALLATLVRPAQVNGRAVSTLVRVPFAFSIRGGTGRAR